MKRALTLLAFVMVALLLCGPGRTAPQSTLPTLPLPLTVQGRVMLDDDRPAVGYTVVVSSTDYVSPVPAGTAVTDASGRYSVVITPAPASLFGEGAAPADTHFSVTIRIGDGLYLSPAVRQIALLPGRGVSGADFRVTVGPQITVRIHDALTGLPIPGMIVKDNLYGGGSDPTLGVTDARGVAVFRLKSLNVDLTLEPPGGTAPAVQAAPGYPFYKQMSETQAQDVTWDVRTYPVPLPPTVLWHGVVLEPDGRPAAGATVHILCHQYQRPDTEVVLGTDGAGRFSAALPPLGAEEYQGYGGDKLFAIWAERGARTVLMTPPPDASWDGLTLRLTDTPMASYTGTVVDAQGRPEADVSVSCRGGLSVADVGLSRDAVGGVTDGAGRFIIPGLPAGGYVLTLGGGPFGLTTVPPSQTRHPDLDTWLTLAAGQQADLGRIVVPVADQVVAGRIVTDAGAIPATVSATLTGAHTNETVLWDAAGRFRVSHIVAEPLTLTISGDFLVAPNSYTTRVIQTTPVQAGQHDLNIVLPAASLPPPMFSPPAPAAAPAAPPPAPAPPPQVTVASGVEPVGGLFLRYAPQNSGTDPQQEAVFVTLGPPASTYWQGPLTAMDGMRLTAEHGQGTLVDRAGHVLWAGTIRKPPAYTIVITPGTPRRVRVLDAAGRTLWAGPVPSSGPAVTFPYGDITVTAPDGTIAWQQPQAPGSVAYRTGADGWGASYLPDGVVTFSVTQYRAVFRDRHENALYAGNLLLLTATGMRQGKPVPPGPGLWFPQTVFPYTVAYPLGPVRYTLTDSQGRTIQEAPCLSQ